MAGSCTSWSGYFALDHMRRWPLVLKRTPRGQNVSRLVWKRHHNILECVGTSRQQDTSLSVFGVLPEIWNSRLMNNFQNHHDVSHLCRQRTAFNHLTPNGHFSGRTAPLTSRCCILYIYSTNIRTEYFKHAAHSPFFPLQNNVYFIMLPFLVHVLFTF